jgi:dipeptidyl aminopeptidase/acylaminoacyl peptidase
MGTYDVARYLAVDEVTTPTITPDGQLLFLADTTGTPQVWTADEPGEWPTRLTPHDERVSTVSASPTAEAFVFGMDQGSDERDQLFHYDLESGEERALTDDPESKHAWGAWGPQGEQIFFTANREEAGRFDVYSLDVTDPDADPQKRYEGPGGWLHVGAVDAAGERLALLKPNASFDVTLSVLDLETGETTDLSDGEPAVYHHPHFDTGGDGDGGSGSGGGNGGDDGGGDGGDGSGDGDNGSLYCVTDSGTDTTYIGRFDLDSGELEKVADSDGNRKGEPGTGAWNVDEFAYHADTGRVVFTRNEGGYSTVHAGTVEDGAFELAAAPDSGGVVTELTFGPEGERVAFAHTEADDPKSVHVAEFEEESEGESDSAKVTASTEWTPAGTCGIPRESFRTPETIHYETFDGRTIPAYWTLPEGVDPDDPDEQVPTIVDIHGGPEHQRRPWFYPTKQFFLNRGYAVLEPNVRGSSGYGKAYAHLDDVDKRMDSVRDIEQAVAWLHEQDAVDDERIVAYGRSYGGFMVLAAITEYPDLWAAAVEFVGIADFTTFLENTGDWRQSHREAEYGSLSEDRDLLEEISPLHKIDRVSCPLFVQHGANDPRVPVSEAEQVIETARAQGVPVESLIFEDEGHHTTSRENLIEEFEQIAAFLDEYV